MSKSHAVKHARRINQLVIEHKRAGRINEANYCAEYRALWMVEARRAAQ